MPQKTIYVSDDDLATFNEAKKLAGKNLSAVIVKSLKEYINIRTSDDGYEEIRFVTGAHGTNGEKRFFGKLLLDWRGYDNKSHQIIHVKAYTTKKKHVAATVEYRNPAREFWDNQFDFNKTTPFWGVTRKLLVADDPKEFDGVLPDEPAKAIAEAVRSNDDPVEFLDI